MPALLMRAPSPLFLSLPGRTERGAPPVRKKGRTFFFQPWQRFPEAPLSRLQKAWLKAICSDPRFLLFFSEEERDRLSAALEEDGQVTELYKQEEFYYLRPVPGWG